MSPTVSEHDSQRRQWTQVPFDAAMAVWDGWADYWTAATRDARNGGRGVDPLSLLEDGADWLVAATSRSKPEWILKHRVTREWPEARLLDFSTAEPSAIVPTLVLPPQAGHASTVVDYSTDQSQLGTALEAGVTSLYSMDWKTATQETRTSSIERFIAILDEAIDSIGGRANLVGDCQGGWLATIYTALYPDKVNSLAIGGAPIDYHAGQSAIAEWVRSLRTPDEVGFYKFLVALGRGNHLGDNQIAGFKMLEPTKELERLMGLWANIRDPEYVRRHIDFTNWFEWPQDVPGDFYIWIVQHLFVRNELIAGTLAVGDRTVDLGAITCPLFLLVGTRDHITPAEQVFALADYVSTDADHIHREVVEAGHLGLFMGRNALRNHWSTVFAEVERLSIPEQ